MDKSIIDNPRLRAASETINIVIPHGKKLVAEIKNSSSKPYFSMVGNGKKNNLLGKGIRAMDLIIEMSHMTPQEQYLVEQMRNHLVHATALREDGSSFEFPTNVAIISGKAYTVGEKQKIKAGFKRLHSKDIVRRVRREYYMFNPSFIIPYDYDDSFLLWSSLS